jgi:hypothetical protein
MSRRKGKGAPSATATADPAIYYKTPVTPEEAFQAIGRLRKEARDEIDRLIQFLDKTDDYVSRELEDSIDDNPHDDEGEAEPSLGFLDHMTNQTRICEGDGGPDAEDEHDGAEPDECGEPSLGSVGDVHFDQERWAYGNSRDFEQDDGESGIADQDGLDEQVPFRDWQMVGMV